MYKEINVSLDTGAVLEFYLKLVNTGNYGGVLLEDSNGNYFGGGVVAGVASGYALSTGTLTGYINTGSVSVGRVYHCTFKITSSGTEYYVDGTQVLTNSVQCSNNFTKIYLIDAGNTNSLMIDDVIIRKYVDQEPYASVEQLSTDTWKVTIYNPNPYNLNDFQVKINGTGIVSSDKDSLLITDDISQLMILTNRGIYAVGESVNVNVYVPEQLLNNNIIVYWGDGSSDVQNATTQYINFSHIYQSEGTYTITAVCENQTATKTIVVSSNVVLTTIKFLPLVASMNISNDTKIYVSSPIDSTVCKFNETATIHAYLNNPISIQTDAGYITTIKAINGTTFAYIGSTEFQYASVELKTDTPHNVEAKVGDKVVAYGNPAYATVPLGTILSIYIDGIYYKDITVYSAISRYIPFTEIYPKFILTNNIKNELILYIGAGQGVYRVLLYKDGQQIDERYIQASDKPQVINYGNLGAGNYSAKILDSNGMIISTLKYEISLDNKMDFSSQPNMMKAIMLAIFIGTIVILGLISQEWLWIGFLAACSVIIVLPFSITWNGVDLKYLTIPLALITFLVIKYKQM